MRLNETNQTKIRGVEHPHIFDKFPDILYSTQEPVKLAKKECISRIYEIRLVGIDALTM